MINRIVIIRIQILRRRLSSFHLIVLLQFCSKAELYWILKEIEHALQDFI